MQGSWKMLKTLTVVMLIAIAYSAFMEGLQHTITENRVAELGDIWANTAGVLIGGGVIQYCLKLKKLQPQQY